MISEEQLYTLIHSLLGAANARTIDTGKYFIANSDHAINHGFSDINASIGINYAEVQQHRREQLAGLKGSLALEDKHTQRIQQLNWQADRAKEPFSSYICTLFPTGCIHTGLLKKIPLLSYTGKTLAVLTFLEDKTHELDLLKLYAMYKRHYPMQQAIIQFLRYLNIKKYFQKIPTNQELIILLILRKNSASKYAAKSLGINHRTVEEYKARLRNKLFSVSLESLLILLRMPRKILPTCVSDTSNSMERTGE